MNDREARERKRANRRRRAEQRRLRRERREQRRNSWWIAPGINTIEADRWGLIMFGGDGTVRERIAQAVPGLHGLLRIQTAPSYWGMQFGDPDYVRLAVNAIDGAIHEGSDVLLSFHDGAADLHHPDHAGAIVTICEALAARQVEHAAHDKPAPSGKVLGLVLDAEWENSVYADSREAYVQSVVAITRAIRSSAFPLPIFGPGGTHSDDHSLARVLEDLERADARPDHACFHAYSDKGAGSWYDNRLEDLRRIFDAHGFDTACCTECGVTGEKDWGDRDDGGTSDERHHRRTRWLINRLNRETWITLKLYFQVTQARGGNRDEHSSTADWGLLKPHATSDRPLDWIAKPSVQEFR